MMAESLGITEPLRIVQAQKLRIEKSFHRYRPGGCDTRLAVTTHPTVTKGAVR
jgi:hypothetical protein